MWYLDSRERRRAKREWKVRKGDHDPGRARGYPARPAPLLQGFKAVPPLVTDINLSLDDRWLYVSCWGTGSCGGTM
jgi:selenium-binding protein 1